MSGYFQEVLMKGGGNILKVAGLISRAGDPIGINEEEKARKDSHTYISASSVVGAASTFHS